MDLVGHVDEISRSVIQGWVIDTERPDTTITLSIFVNNVHRGMCLTTHARDDLVLPNGEKLSGKCGFHFAFEPPLSPFVELRIDVVETWSGQVLRNGSRVLPRPRSHDGDGKGMVPVLLTSTGRTGTTLLMSEFARHPYLVVGDQFPYEIKQIAYHAAAFRALVADADWERSTKPETMLSAEMRNIIGSNPYKMSGLFGLGGGSYLQCRPARLRQAVPLVYVDRATLHGKLQKQFESSLKIGDDLRSAGVGASEPGDLFIASESRFEIGFHYRMLPSHPLDKCPHGLRVGAVFGVALT